MLDAATDPLLDTPKDPARPEPKPYSEMRLLPRTLPALLLLVLAASATLGSCDSVPASRGDAVWLGTGTTNTWVRADATEQEVERMLAELDSHGIRRLFANIGVVNHDATAIIGEEERPPVSTAELARFLGFVAAYEAKRSGARFTLLAGICVANGEPVGDWPACDTESPAVRDRLAAYAVRILGVSSAGAPARSFDGLHLDIEPAGGDELFERSVAVVGAVRGLAPHAELSLASPRILSEWDGPRERRWYWTPDQYRAAAALVSELSPMVYVPPDRISHDFTVESYQSYVREQAVSIARALSDTQTTISIGVPTYWQTDGAHHEQMDLRNTLLALNSALADLCHSDPRALRRITGVSLFWYEKLAGNDALWQQYLRLRADDTEARPSGR